MHHSSLSASLNIFMDIIQTLMLEGIAKDRKGEFHLLKSPF